MFSKALIATDLSAASLEIVHCASGLKPLGTREILLVQCITPIEAASVAFAEDNKKVEAILNDQKEILSAEGFETHTEVVLGSVHKEINRAAYEQDYSFVMVGTHGRTLSRDILLGSVASEIIQSARKPVLVVRLNIINDSKTNSERCVLPEFCKDFHSSILFPTDFSHNADNAFIYVENIVERGAKSITLLHVLDSEVLLERHSTEMVKEFDDIKLNRLNGLKEKILNINADINISVVLAHGKPISEILKVSKSIKPSLIVMGSQGKGYVKELFLGSISHAVTRIAETCVFLVPSMTEKR